MGFDPRDRDKIRQDILEGLGWSIYRVWSTDWFNDPDRETARMLEWLEKQRKRQRATVESRQMVIGSELSAFEAPPPVHEEIPPHTIPTDDDRATEQPIAVSRKPEASSMSQENAEALPLFGAPIKVKPKGQHRRLDDIDYYEVEKGVFEIWVDGERVGEVERVDFGDIQRAHLYGGSVTLQKPRFRGTLVNSEVFFEIDDIYAAIRRVASDAAQLQK